MKISLYKNTVATNKIKDIPISEFFSLIKSDTYKKLISGLRNIKNEKGQASYKRTQLPAVTISGTFKNAHKKSELLQHSGLIQVDIDKIEDISTIQSLLYADDYTYTGFVSPRGTGIKLIVKIEADSEKHCNSFLAPEEYYKNKYNIEIDKSCKDVSRLCFISYDPDIYINHNSKIFNHKAFTQIQSGNSNQLKPNQKLKDYYFNRNNFDEFVDEIENQSINITETYNDWLKAGFAIANTFGANGENYFHRISKQSNKYSFQENQKQFNDCLKSNNGKVNIDTLFYLAKENGLKVPKLKTYYKKTNKVSKFNTEPKPKTDKKNKYPVELIMEYISESYDIRYNEILSDFEWKEKQQASYNSFNENQLYIELLRKGYKTSMQLITLLVQSDFIEKYNPFVEYLHNLPKWDRKTDHIGRLASYLKIRETGDFKFLYHFKKWFIRVVRCMIDDSFFNKQMIVFVQETQNGGKTTFCRFLCLPKLQRYCTETIATGKDEDIQLATNFLICYDEMGKLIKTDIQQIKSLMSRLTVNIRLPYAKRQTLLNRRCSFIGNTNNLEFLNDETGSIWFLCFDFESIDFNYSKNINIDDVYSQAYSLYLSGEPHEITKGDSFIIQQYNKIFSVITPEQELILRYFSVCEKSDEKA